MLFNSYTFIFLFLPIVLGVYYGTLSFAGLAWAARWIVVASLFYYAWWRPIYLVLLLFSIFVNFGFAKALLAYRGSPSTARLLITLGVAFNLTLLGYFKYAGFFVSNVDALTGAGFAVPQIVLPIGISFVTFQKIAFLVDVYKGLVTRLSLQNYMFFVSFFPQLIAGPIVHHQELIPQLETPQKRDRSADLAVGISLFCVGLFKKVVIADTCATYADAGYGMVQAGHPIGAASAMIAVLSFSFQIYYDFSAYSDMAIGLARMFGFALPVNFFSPYKSTGFVEFWRRWHITLSRFLRDYLYIPLGGNRRGPLRQVANLILVMLLGGLWHGANWTFVAWGTIHGALLGINHAWSKLRVSRHRLLHTGPVHVAAVLVTFVLATLAWIPFRAQSFAEAHRMAASLFAFGSPPDALAQSYTAFLAAQFPTPDVLFDLTGWIKAKELWPPVLPPDFLATSRPIGLWLALVALGTFLLPNTYQIFARFDPALGLDRFARPRRLGLRRLGWGAAFACAAMFVVAVLQLNHVTPFLYFQF